MVETRWNLLFKLGGQDKLDKEDIVPEGPAQVDNGRQSYFVYLFFDSLRRPSQYDRPVSRPSPAPVLNRDGPQSCSKLRCENRTTGLEMSCCPVNELLWVQITQSYPNRLRFSSLPRPQSPCHALIFPVF
jgi:hypothetical protein